MNISICITVYNEIRFIRRTLESIISEADEILISDYGSTDGTLEVIEEFSAKYPKIIYANHKDLPYSDRLNWLLKNAHGKYIRLVGGHDMVSHGSSKSMAALLDNNPDAVMAYSKYCIELNSDYSFYNFLNMQEPWIETLSSDSPFDRIRERRYHWYIYYSLYRKDILMSSIMSPVFVGVQTDVGIFSVMASSGKLLADEFSVFFWMNPRPRLDFISEFKRTALTISQGKNDHPFYWPFLVMCEEYCIAKEMETWESAPDNFGGEFLTHIIQGRQFLFSKEDDYKIDSSILSFVKIQPRKEYLCNEVLNTILNIKRERDLEHKREQEDTERKRKQDARLLNRIKRIIKCALPYGLICHMQLKHNQN
jgi:glycosyltransferase involved in cell wall biosynthesis